MKRLTKNLVAMLAMGVISLSTSGCGEDISEQTAAWTTLLGSTGEKITALGEQLSTMKGALDGLPDFSSIASLAAGKAALGEKLGALPTALEAVKTLLAGQTEAVTKAFATKKIADAQAALEGAQTAIGGALETCGASFGEAQSEVTKWTEYATLFEGVQKVREAAAAEHPPTVAGNVDFLDIDFKSASAEFEMAHDNTKPALDRLVALTTACKQMQFEIHGHASREGNAEFNNRLSGERAIAIKTYLLGAGVKASQITNAEGHGSVIPAVAEPDPAGEEAKAMNPDLLEAIRMVNRRVSVNITTPCAG